MNPITNDWGVRTGRKDGETNGEKGEEKGEEHGMGGGLRGLRLVCRAHANGVVVC